MDLLTQDKRFVWHPFTQQKTASTPFIVERGEGAYLYTNDGRVILDAISSWWVNIHGHCHPYLVEKVSRQLQKLEQVIFAGATHEQAILLAERVVSLLPTGFSRVFYSDNGSTAVEVAIKMALQYWHNQQRPRLKLLALRNSYHGDTFGAMAVGDRSVFTKAFWPLLFDVIFIDPPLRGEAASDSLGQLKAVLEDSGGELAALIYEPLVQGAGGMLMQDPTVLDKMLALIKKEGILCIADEVMTGFGRTGKLFASDHMETKPDIICLSKGLTGGTLPLSVTVCREEVYEAFLSDDKAKAFFHGHSFTANSLGCAAALASLDLLLDPVCLQSIERIGQAHAAFRERLASSRLMPAFRNIRQQGTILALEIATGEETGYFNQLRDEMATFFLEQGVLLRPLGNVVYIIPPYCVTTDDLDIAYRAIEGFAAKVLGI